MKYYAVFDTNVLVSSLLTKRTDTATAMVVDAISAGDIVPLYNADILDEYDEVLHRAKFPFSETSIQKILTMIQTMGIEVFPESSSGEVLPDMDDIVFYEVVMEKRADDAYLITGNIKHFPRREYIVTPAEMMELLNNQ